MCFVEPLTLSLPVLQEREFLKNYVQRIVDVRPTLVLVEKTVSRIAQDMLLEHGITLVINVKPVSAERRSHSLQDVYTHLLCVTSLCLSSQQVLDRVSRMTQGDLVNSMDQLLTKPRLGTCHKFYMQPFTLASGEQHLHAPWLLGREPSMLSVCLLVLQVK